MIQTDTVTLLQKTDCVVAYVILVLRDTIPTVRDTSFKMVLVTRFDTLKERHTLLQHALEAHDASILEVSHTDFDVPGDKGLVHGLFTLCNQCVEAIYTFINHYKPPNQKVENLIKEGVKAIERLREDLAPYL